MERVSSRIRFVIFDLDGTLVDSAPDILVATNRMLEAMGRPLVDMPQIKRMIGDGVRKLVERALAATGEAQSGAALDAALDRFYAFYMEAPSALTRPYPGAVETLAQLHQRGVVLGVCTNKPAQAAQAILDDLGLAPYLSGLSGGDSASARKPDPIHVLDALSRVNGEAGAAVMVGDSEHDIHAGKAAGMLLSIGVTHGYARVPLDETGADRLIAGFAELIPTLEESGLAKASA